MRFNLFSKFNAFKGMERDFLLFILAGVFLGMAQSVDGSTLNNFLKDRFNFVIEQRAALEFPRELPGFLVFISIGVLSALGDIRIAVIANIMAAAGMFFLGIIPANYALMLACIFVYSSGTHIYMPLSNSIAMSFAKDGRLGRKLGQVSAANTAALVGGSALLWVLFKFVKISYTVSFSIGAAAFIAAAILLAFINPLRTVKIKNRFIFRKEYGLYYWLSVLYGARKQILITFGPWVLVDVFKVKVTTMTVLFFIVAVSGIFVKPMTGALIDRKGERFVLGTEAALFFAVCLGYTFADDILPGYWPVIMVSACYVLDQTLNAVSMARATYMKKIAIDQSHVLTTLSTGISIDHIMSMFLPLLGGYIWSINGAQGYKPVFLGGAVIAVLNFVSTRFIRTGTGTGVGTGTGIGASAGADISTSANTITGANTDTE